MKKQRRWFVALAALGVLVLLVELLRYWFAGHEIHGWPVAIGCALAFVGFYGLDPASARDGGTFLVSSAVSILGTIRSGRRSTDVRAVVTPAETDEIIDDDFDDTKDEHVERPQFRPGGA